MSEIPITYVVSPEQNARWHAEEQAGVPGWQVKMAGASTTQEGGTHYKTMGVQPWDVVDTWPVEQQIGHYRAGALKYLMRLGHKDEALQEAKKAKHYCEKLIEVLSNAKL